MDEQTRKDLLAKREQVSRQIKQAEADLYFLQGQIALLDDLLKQEKPQDDPSDAVV